jgi:uncharacterized protein (TIGR02421 family)
VEDWPKIIGTRKETSPRIPEMIGKAATYSDTLSPASLSVYETAVRTLSNRLVEAQRPIRILDAVKLDDEMERGFFAATCRELPAVTRESYRPLPFDPAAKLLEFAVIERQVVQQLGDSTALGRIMVRMCREYSDVVRMLAARGTRAFSALSQQLYGSPRDRDSGVSAFVQLASERASLPHHPHDWEQRVEARDAVLILADRLTAYFRSPDRVRVKLSDGIIADAAAGADYIKLRANASFNARDLRILEVHEGWVHLGTTLNGQAQPVCTFLSKGPPSSTITQEGLAVLTELLTGAAHPARWRRLARRIEGVRLAAEGADFLDVYRHFTGQGCSPRESYQHTARIFRGSLPAGCGPFTKDLCYGKGFLLVRDFLAQSHAAYQSSLLFCGKTMLADLPALAELISEGIVSPPEFIPPPFQELARQVMNDEARTENGE